MYSLKNSIIGASLLAALCIGFAPSAEAQSSVSQTADHQTNVMPREAFYDIVTESLRDITDTDLPAIVAAVNSLVGGTGSVSYLEVASRGVTVGPNGTNSTPFAWETGLCTNGNTVTFGTPFLGTPAVLVTPNIAYLGTNTAISVTSKNPTNFVVGGTGAAEGTWFAIGIK